jgi:hypothetical protein
LIISGGALGAVIAGLRRNEFSLLRDVALGISSGFVAYMAIRGGKYVFVSEHSENGIILNPYGCTFVALLTGLFTDRAYTVLSDLVDGLIRKIKTATE